MISFVHVVSRDVVVFAYSLVLHLAYTAHDLFFLAGYESSLTEDGYS